MIIAKVHGYLPEQSGMLIQFSEPDETFKTETCPLVVVSSEADLFRRLYYKNKTYCCDTLSHWLNQRAHANPSSATSITFLATVIKTAKTVPYETMCHLIAQNRNRFEELIHENSPYYRHYLRVIEPILKECENVHTGKAKVHYY